MGRILYDISQNYMGVIRSSRLFSGIEPDEVDGMSKCLEITFREYDKEEVIFNEGDKITKIGMVIQGNVSIEQADYWGNRHIMTYVSLGEIFGEAYACSNDKTSNVEVVAADKCIVAFLDTYKVMTVCSSSCQFHSKLIHNLIYMLAERCVVMNEKITHLSKRSTKEKVLSYLSARAAKYGSDEFDIPFNRQQLADYLSVDRSAMSAELSRMKKNGEIDFRKNHFIIKCRDKQ